MHRFEQKNFEVIYRIKFLLKEKGLTINGVKKLLESSDIHSLDASTDLGVYKSDFFPSKIVKEKVKKISKIIKELKKLKNG